MNAAQPYRGRAPHKHWLTKWTNRPIAVLSWATAILLAGIWSATQIPLELVPQVELQEVHITAGWAGASPRAVERYITAPIERAVQRVPGTEHVESRSSENSSFVSLQILKTTDLGLYVAQVNEQLTLLRNVLPDHVTPRLTKQVPAELKDEQGFMDIQLVGPMAPDVLRSMAEREIKPKLQSIPGVSEITVTGGTERELRITLNPDRLSAFGIGPALVRSRLFDLLGDEDYGRLRGKGRSALLLRSPETDLDRFRSVVLRASADGTIRVTLSDVADVEVVAAPITSISRVDGLSVVALRLDRSRGSHMVRVAEAVYASLEEQRQRLPADTRLIVVADKTVDVRQQLRDLGWRGGSGFLLVILVLLFMLRSVRATFVVLFSVSVALAVALIALQAIGLSLNLLTIAGLVLVFGLLVDNAVVVVEQLLIRKGPDSAVESLRIVWLPLVGGTLSTMAVMLPLIYLSGNLQSLFVPFGVVVSLALAASLAAAALLVPVAGIFLPEHVEHSRKRPFIKGLVAFPFRLVSQFPRISIVTLILLLGVPFWKLPSRMTDDRKDNEIGSAHDRFAGVYNAVMDTDWVRDARAWLDPALGGVMRPFTRSITFGSRWSFERKPEVSVSMTFPPGHPIDRADSLMQQFERVALASASVSRTITQINKTSANMRVQFHEAALKTAEPYVMRERLIGQAINIGGIYIYVGGLLPQGYSSGFGGGMSGMRVEALGPNYEDLDAMVRRFASKIQSRSRRVAGVNLNAGRWGRFSSARQVLRFDWTPDAAIRSGVSSQELAGMMAPIFSQQNRVGRIDLQDNVQTPVRLVVRDAETIDIDRFSGRPFTVSDSTVVRLAGLADYTIEERPSAIQRTDQQYKRTIAIDFRGPPQMANEFLERELSAFALPVGYSLKKASFTFFTGEVQRAFGWVLLATFLLVFIITAAVFESWKLPIVVMLSVPLAGIGVALGFMWTESNFAEGAFIGAILMVGIAVNDSILLVDRFRQFRDLRPSTPSSVLARLAARDRLRPMYTTTMTSIAAMLPLLLFPDSGDFWMGLAVTVVGGLAASTLLAPLASVAVLSLGERNRSPAFWRKLLNRTTIKKRGQS